MTYCYIKYSPTDGGEGFVRTDEIVVLQDRVDREKHFTAIRLADGHELYAKEAAADLLDALLLLT